ncbi:MAG: FMN-binding glutamate synthase family protein, partial [Altererythrobacter sp.]|nr:FMN-binding glutamate synthase family protein [Altererythrobacter sp.]
MANILDWLSSLFVFTIGIVALVLVVLFIIDRTQTQDAVRHNYPVIGRLRYV